MPNIFFRFVIYNILARENAIVTCYWSADSAGSPYWLSWLTVPTDEAFCCGGLTKSRPHNDRTVWTTRMPVDTTDHYDPRLHACPAT